MFDLNLPIIHVFIFAILLMLSWLGGSLATSQNFNVAITVHQQLAGRFEALQQRHDKLVAEHDQLQSQKWQMDAKIRELLREVDRLSAELYHLKNRPPDENQGSAR
jgi:cell division protein FtsB